MPPLDANDEMDASAISEIDDTVDAGQSAVTPNADSSAATGENAEPDLLSVVRDVVDKRKPDDASASPAEGSEATVEAEGAADEKAEDFSDVPFNQHPRWKQILTQRNSARAERDSFKQDAERYQNVQTYIDSQGLTADEAADMLLIAGLMKTNPVEAWKRARPVIQNLLVAAGEVLPGDIKQMVDEGKMSREAALEVSRSRAAVQSVQARSTFDTERAQQQRQREALAAFQNAAEDWQADRKLKDPNFAAKIEPLHKEILYLQHSEGKPKTPAEVKAQLDRAYKAVNAALPKPAPKPPVPVAKGPQARPASNGVVAAQAKADPPNSTMDILKRVVAERAVA